MIREEWRRLVFRVEDLLAGPSGSARRWRTIFKALRYLHRHGWRSAALRVVPSLRRHALWFRLYGRPGQADIAAIRGHIGRLAWRPTVSLAVALGDRDEPLAATVASVCGQLYPDWELLLAGPAVALARVKDQLAPRLAAEPRIRLIESAGGGEGAALNACVAAAAGEFVAWLDTGDLLAPHALYTIAAEAEGHAEAAILYTDEDAIDARCHHHDPRYKTDWNPDLFLGHDAIGRLTAIRRDLVAGLGGVRAEFGDAALYDLTLRASERVTPDRIRHIPLVLYHRRDRGEAPHRDAAAYCRAVAEHLIRTKADATATTLPSGHVRVRYRLPTPKPPVSLIVPTRDQAGLLRQCVDGLLRRTDYEPLEIVIVDNNSEAPETFAYFAELASDNRVRILAYPGRFNYSAINNFAVAGARHEIIGLINNDIDVIHADWLDEMVSHAIRPEIGAVGAKLYYPDDTIQHAGTIVGLHGGADHAFRHRRRGDAGYLDRLLLTQNLSALTAACLIMRKSVYDEVGGLDADNLTVAYNDVDLCLRVRARGYRIVWTPFAELYHHESASRGHELTPEKAARFRREVGYLAGRWPEVIAHDPYYNPNLEIIDDDFGLAFPPRTVPPWRSERA